MGKARAGGRRVCDAKRFLRPISNLGSKGRQTPPAPTLALPTRGRALGLDGILFIRQNCPHGALTETAGLKISVGGKPVKWTRDPVEVYAFYVDTPASACSPVRLLVERNKRYEQIDIAYSGGLRYPHLESTTKGETAMDRLLAPRRK